VIGFDVERHVYGEERYPGQLVLQDVLTLDGRQFRNAGCIVASPPCQKFSYMAMPWSRAKREVRWQQWERDSPLGDRLAGLRALFDACFRIQREASEAGGRHIPMVVENVKGAQPWVGPARANFGNFYFWGDVAMVGGRVVAGKLRVGDFVRAAKRGSKRNPDGTNHPQGSWFAVGSFQSAAVTGVKVAGIKHGGDWFSDPASPGRQGGVKQHGSGPEWFDQGIAKHSSRSDSRKAASAQIAKIPFPLASYIARQFKPR
jgi:hypothetical protein